MFYAQLLRLEAERYRVLASHAANRQEKEEDEDLAEVLDEVAVEAEEKETSG